MNSNDEEPDSDIYKSTFPDEVFEVLPYLLVILVLLSIGSILFIMDLFASESGFSICCTPGIMGIVVILTGVMILKHDVFYKQKMIDRDDYPETGLWGGGIILFGILMIIVAIMILLYYMVV
jgi:hypothetical protein